MKNRVMMMVLILGMVILLSGCNKSLPTVNSSKASRPALIHVEITFEGGHTLKGYVKQLTLGEDSIVYSGGMNSTYLYDSKGRIIGVFNYSRVLYIKKI